MCAWELIWRWSSLTECALKGRILARCWNVDAGSASIQTQEHQQVNGVMLGDGVWLTS